MSFDVTQMTALMLDAASRSVLCWPAIRLVGRCEIARYAQILEDVRQLYANGVIEEDEAFEIANAHRIASQAVLRAVQSVGAKTARDVAPRVMKAALDVVRPDVNRIIGFPLI